MYRTIIIDDEQSTLIKLKQKILDFCPSLELSGVASTKAAYRMLLEDAKNEIIFINPSLIDCQDYYNFKQITIQKALICISDSTDFADVATFWHSVGYLLKPVQIKKLLVAIDSARTVLNARNEKPANFSSYLRREDRLLGIPTIEGLDVILIDQIIRCEGLQKYTRIVTCERTDIISSYNIGIFKKLLANFGCFFTPHRSHIINVLFIDKFKKSGTIILKDGTCVPVAKNRKDAFLNRITRL